MWDKQIDDVARKLTRGEAPSGLRSRVLQRIDLDVDRHPVWMHVAVSLVAAVALVSLFVAIIMSTKSHEPEPPRTVAARPSPSPNPEPQPVRGADRSISGRAVEATLLRHVLADSLPTSLRRDDTVLFALPDSVDIESLGIPALEPDQPVTTEAITTEPLVVEPLEIRPLDDRALDHQ